MVLAYRAMQNVRDEFSTYNQQDHYFEEEGIFGCCPREASINDLALALQNFREMEDNVCLLIDANEDVHNEESDSGRVLAEASLKDTSIRKFGLCGPAIRCPGSGPIDGLFLHENVPVDTTGYLSYIDELSDHRPLFVDIPSAHIFGEANATFRK